VSGGCFPLQTSSSFSSYKRWNCRVLQSCQIQKVRQMGGRKQGREVGSGWGEWRVTPEEEGFVHKMWHWDFTSHFPAAR
jgi:hypothetical protein